MRASRAADSRIAPEYSGRGDLFVCRVAGNVYKQRDDRKLRNIPRPFWVRHSSWCWDTTPAVQLMPPVAQGQCDPAGPPSFARDPLAAAAKAGAAPPGDPLGNAIRQT
jgi:hypothetical protein